MGSSGQEKVSLGALQQAVDQRLEQLFTERVGARLAAAEAGLFSSDPAVLEKVGQRLGWVQVAAAMTRRVPEIHALREELREAGYRRVLLLGMGGSSLCPEVLARTLGGGADGLELRVLDSTHPDAVAAAEEWAEPGSTAYLVASKSGTTTEVVSFFRSFRARSGNGRDFLAVTDPDTFLQELAEQDGFRHVFLNPADIGGRFSALSLFGMVPAGLLGIDATELLRRAEELRQAAERAASSAQHPGLLLGAILGEAARAGRNKLTLLLDPALASLGSWIEQLVAESTGKEGRGILPVDGEPELDAAQYGDDRLFVATCFAGGGDAGLARRVDALRAAGQPLVEITLADRLDLGAEFYRWEVATAVAGLILGINPFDEPNVKESKDLTREFLEVYARDGRLPEGEILAEDDELRLYGSAPAEGGVDQTLMRHLQSLGPGDYLALLAYLPGSAEIEAELARLRALLATGRHATTLGFGPRFLHSTGQLHKGGPNQGVFLQITADPEQQRPVPEADYDFATLVRAQSLGDLKALARRDRRALRCHLRGPVLPTLKRLRQRLQQALGDATHPETERRDP